MTSLEAAAFQVPEEEPLAPVNASAMTRRKGEISRAGTATGRITWRFPLKRFGASQELHIEHNNIISTGVG
jgi:hypothetical protein